MTKVEELFKDIECTVLTSTGALTGPVGLAKLLSERAVYRLPVILLPVKDKPPVPKSVSRRNSSVCSASKGGHEKKVENAPGSQASYPGDSISNDLSEGVIGDSTLHVDVLPRGNGQDGDTDITCTTNVTLPINNTSSSSVLGEDPKNGDTQSSRVIGDVTAGSDSPNDDTQDVRNSIECNATAAAASGADQGCESVEEEAMECNSAKIDSHNCNVEISDTDTGSKKLPEEKLGSVSNKLAGNEEGSADKSQCSVDSRTVTVTKKER